MNDSQGNEINVGDKVCFVDQSRNYGDIKYGIIDELTAKNAWCRNSWGTSRVLRSPSKIVAINGLKRSLEDSLKIIEESCGFLRSLKGMDQKLADISYIQETDLCVRLMSECIREKNFMGADEVRDYYNRFRDYATCESPSKVQYSLLMGLILIQGPYVLFSKVKSGVIQVFP